MDIIIQSMHRNLISITNYHTKLKTHSFPFLKTTCNWTNISLWDEDRRMFINTKIYYIKVKTLSTPFIC